MTDDPTLLSGIAGALAGAITGGTPLILWIVRLRQQRHEQERQIRADVVSEWQELTDHLQQQVTRQEKQIAQLHQQHLECERRAVVTEAQLKSLRERVQQLQDLLQQLTQRDLRDREGHRS